MSVRLMAEVWARYEGTGNELLLALAIADFAADDGRSIYPSIATLANKTRQSERTVQRQLRAMEESGWISVVGNENGGRNNTRIYQVSPSWIKGDSLTPPPERVTSTTERVTSTTLKGDIAVSPETSRTISKKQPSEQTFSPPIGDVLLKAWKEVRKAKRAGPVTELVWKGIEREAKAAGISAEDAVTICCERGWQAFKADWIKPKTFSQPEQPKPAAQVFVSPQVQKTIDRKEYGRKLKEVLEKANMRIGA